jgi:hypothetical protein
MSWYFPDIEIKPTMAGITAEKKQAEMGFAFENSDLPDQPDINMINDLTYRIRDRFYKETEERLPG